MNDVPFHQTRMGHTFYDVTMPALVEAIERLNQNLERLAAPAAQPATTAPTTTPAPPTGRGE